MTLETVCHHDERETSKIAFDSSSLYRENSRILQSSPMQRTDEHDPIALLQLVLFHPFKFPVCLVNQD